MRGAAAAAPRLQSSLGLGAVCHERAAVCAPRRGGPALRCLTLTCLAGNVQAVDEVGPVRFMAATSQLGITAPARAHDDAMLGPVGTGQHGAGAGKKQQQPASCSANRSAPSSCRGFREVRGCHRRSACRGDSKPKPIPELGEHTSQLDPGLLPRETAPHLVHAWPPFSPRGCTANTPQLATLRAGRATSSAGGQRVSHSLQAEGGPDASKQQQHVHHHVALTAARGRERP